ncbi:nuclear transport factor 2 family protein [Streptomyces sp. RS10V-4]|uniref:nuclear transport factor 2 family protein n=1 Tax=Streptomyces rhizoryzae TaxID=2932493 RepID=UPI00200382DA|nr:nuclear transport factor 2 family protein [Streptomyces rhizoryzae]MCK7622467.1 nuclear transport factor 2 family protein [Streptomyces rhizoryzae]
MTSAPAPATAPARRTPEELFRHGLRLLLDQDMTGWVDLWDDAGVFEFPFAPEDRPRRLEGKPAIAAYMADYPRHIELHDFPEVTVHQTQDAATIVVEMAATGRLVATGAPFAMSYVAVVTVHDGRIAHYRDYWNPLGVPASMRA